MLVCPLLIRNFFRNVIRVSNSLDPDQAQHFVGPDLGPNCLQRLSTDDTCRVKFGVVLGKVNCFCFSAQKHELQKKHKELLLDCQSKPHNLALVKVQIERELEVWPLNLQCCPFITYLIIRQVWVQPRPHNSF